MARPLASLLLLPTLLAGCYLFSDEPKARKHADAGPSWVDEGAGEEAPAADEGEPAAPGSEIADCPPILTGTEIQARTIAAGCEGVRVRGQYRIDGGSLTIAAGVELRFEAGAVLEVGRARPGTLIVQGSAEQPVRFVAEAPGSRWQGLRLLAQARGTTLSHLQLVDAGEVDGAALQITGAGVAIDHLRIDGPAGLIDGPAGLAVDISAEAEVSLVDADIAGAPGAQGRAPVRVTPGAAGGLQDLRLAPEAMVAIGAGRVQGAVEWAAGRYRLDGVIRVEGDADRPALLTLAPGVELRVATGARLIVGGFGPGALTASAATELPADLPVGAAVPSGDIVLRAAEGEQAGAWAGIQVQNQGQLRLRGVELAHGGERDEGVILAEGTAVVRVEGCRFVRDLVAVELRGHELTVEAFTDNDFAEVPVALRLSPQLLGQIGAGNHYDEAAHIEVGRGKIETDATWAEHSAPIHVLGDVYVDKGATLTVAAGEVLAFAKDAVLGVGYYERGALDLRARADARIVLRPIVTGAGGGERWGGIVLGGFARDTHLEQVQLQATQGPGVELRDAAEATLVNVDCAGCGGATVQWSCAAKVGNIAITASAGEGGAPAGVALKAPSGCK